MIGLWCGYTNEIKQDTKTCLSWNNRVSENNSHSSNGSINRLVKLVQGTKVEPLWILFECFLCSCVLILLLFVVVKGFWYMCWSPFRVFRESVIIKSFLPIWENFLISSRTAMISPVYMMYWVGLCIWNKLLLLEKFLFLRRMWRLCLIGYSRIFIYLIIFKWVLELCHFSFGRQILVKVTVYHRLTYY